MKFCDQYVFGEFEVFRKSCKFLHGKPLQYNTRGLVPVYTNFFSSRVSLFHFRPTAFSPQSDLSFSRSFASKPEKEKKKIGKNSRRLILFRIDIFTFRSKLRRSLSDIFILLDTSKQENFTRVLGGFAVKHIHQSRSVSLCHEFSISLSDSGGLKSLSNPAAKFKETICARTNILRTYQTLEGVYVLFIIQI